MATVTDQSWLARMGQYHPRLIEAAMAMNQGDIPRAEHFLRSHLKENPFEVAAIRMLAEVAGRTVEELCGLPLRSLLAIG